jgi:DNA repair protein RecO (recombination protein O)
MLLTTKAIVLSKRKLEDNDALITLMTERSGKLKAIAKGAKSSRSMIAATTQPFTLGEFVLDVGASWNRVRSVEVLESFRHIQEDLMLMGYGAYFLETATQLLQEGEENRGLFQLLSEVLTGLNAYDHRQKGKKQVSEVEADHSNGEMAEQLPIDLEWVKIVYELKLLATMGFDIELKHCVRCGAEGAHVDFSVPEGGAVCSNCLAEGDDRIGRMLFNIMDYVSKQSIEVLMGTKINRLYVSKLDILCMRFMKQHLGYQDFKSLEFLKAIRKV